MPSVKAQQLEAQLERISDAITHCGIADIADEFHDAADAIRQMAHYIRELERQLASPAESSAQPVSGEPMRRCDSL